MIQAAMMHPTFRGHQLDNEDFALSMGVPDLAHQAEHPDSAAVEQPAVPTMRPTLSSMTEAATADTLATAAGPERYSAAASQGYQGGQATTATTMSLGPTNSGPTNSGLRSAVRLTSGTFKLPGRSPAPRIYLYWCTLLWWAPSERAR